MAQNNTNNAKPEKTPLEQTREKRAEYNSRRENIKEAKATRKELYSRIKELEIEIKNERVEQHAHEVKARKAGADFDTVGEEQRRAETWAGWIAEDVAKYEDLTRRLKDIDKHIRIMEGISRGLYDVWGNRINEEANRDNPVRAALMVIWTSRFNPIYAVYTRIRDFLESASLSLETVEEEMVAMDMENREAEAEAEMPDEELQEEVEEIVEGDISEEMSVPEQFMHLADLCAERGNTVLINIEDKENSRMLAITMVAGMVLIKDAEKNMPLVSLEIAEDGKVPNSSNIKSINMGDRTFFATKAEFAELAKLTKGKTLATPAFEDIEKYANAHQRQVDEAREPRTVTQIIAEHTTPETRAEVSEMLRQDNQTRNRPADNGRENPDKSEDRDNEIEEDRTEPADDREEIEEERSEDEEHGHDNEYDYDDGYEYENEYDYDEEYDYDDEYKSDPDEIEEYQDEIDSYEYGEGEAEEPEYKQPEPQNSEPEHTENTGEPTVEVSEPAVENAEPARDSAEHSELKDAAKENRQPKRGKFKPKELRRERPAAPERATVERTADSKKKEEHGLTTVTLEDGRQIELHHDVKYKDEVLKSVQEAFPDARVEQSETDKEQGIRLSMRENLYEAVAGVKPSVRDRAREAVHKAMPDVKMAGRSFESSEELCTAVISKCAEKHAEAGNDTERKHLLWAARTVIYAHQNAAREFPGEEHKEERRAHFLGELAIATRDKDYGDAAKDVVKELLIEEKSHALSKIERIAGKDQTLSEKKTENILPYAMKIIETNSIAKAITTGHTENGEGYFNGEWQTAGMQDILKNASVIACNEAGYLYNIKTNQMIVREDNFEVWKAGDLTNEEYAIEADKLNADREKGDQQETRDQEEVIEDNERTATKENIEPDRTYSTDDYAH